MNDPVASVVVEEGVSRLTPVRLGTAAVYAALVAVLIERMTAVASDLQLLNDGAWFLIRIASTRNYYFWIGSFKHEWFRSRVFTILIEQTPIVLATHLGVRTLHTLSLIYGVTLYSHALLSLYLCYRFAARRWYVLFPLLSFCAGTMNAEAYLSTDSHLIVSLYWPVLFILLFGDELSGGTLWLLLALSFPLLICYESMLLFGIILAAVCLWRRRKSGKSRGLLAGLALWYLLGAGIALAATIFPFDPSNRGGFLRGLLSLIQHDHLAAEASFLVVICCALLLATARLLPHWQLPITLVGGIAVAYVWLQVLLGHIPSSLEIEIPARVLNLYMPLAATGLLLLVLTGWMKPEARAIGLTALLIGLLGFTQAFWNLAAISRWQGLLATLRYELLLHEGPVAFDDSVLSRDRLGPLRLRELQAHWPLPLLSLYETGRGQVRSIILPESGTYLPIDPFSPDDLPDLSRYGIYYDSYRQALRRWHYPMGSTLTFAHGGNAALFLRGKWWFAESWATRSSGPDFGLDLPLGGQNVTTPLLLKAWVAPDFGRDFTCMSVAVTVNDVPVTTWSFPSSGPGLRVVQVEAMIPREVALRADPIRIRFHINRPAECGAAPSGDLSKPALAFIKLQVEATQ